MDCVGGSINASDGTTLDRRTTVNNSYLYIGNVSHELSSFAQVRSRRMVRLKYLKLIVLAYVNFCELKAEIIILSAH